MIHAHDTSTECIGPACAGPPDHDAPAGFAYT
jgi:hypothetical protein